MALSDVLEKIVEWLRAGYPEGVPEEDYVPLFALLSQRLGSDECEQLIDELKREARLSETVTHDMVRKAISTVTEQPALESDVKRVEEHLASVGWVIPEPAQEGD